MAHQETVMKEATAADAGTSPLPTLKRKMFRSSATFTRLAPAAVERQSRISLMAWNLLGPDAARAFLNTYSELLGGRPLDLALANADGFEAVERELHARSSGE